MKIDEQCEIAETYARQKIKARTGVEKGRYLTCGIFLSSCPHERSCVAWVDDEPALLCFVLFDASSPGVGDIWRTQDGDGRQGSKMPDQLVGKTWLCYSYHKLLRLRVPRGCFVLWFACSFPLLGSPYYVYTIFRYLVCVFFTLNRSFYPSTSSKTSVRADSSILERYVLRTSSVVTKLRHRDTTL